MEAIRNRLYSTESFVKGKLIQDKILIEDYEMSEIILNEDEETELVSILQKGQSDLRHRCISVYRDALVTRNFTYNICLSCGDYFKNDERFYLDSDAVEKINNLKFRKKVIKTEK